MNKLIMILATVFIITACDQPKQPDSTQKESSQNTTNTATEITSDSKAVEDEKVDSKKLDSTETADKKTQKDEVQKPEELPQKDGQQTVLKQAELITENDKKDLTEVNNLTKITQNHIVTAEPSVARKSTKVTQEKKRKIQKKRKYNSEINGLSAEERRVGAQRVLTSDEIKYFKMQCRYPYMSAKEIAENNCGVKVVKVDD